MSWYAKKSVSFFLWAGWFFVAAVTARGDSFTATGPLTNVNIDEGGNITLPDDRGFVLANVADFSFTPQGGSPVSGLPGVELAIATGYGSSDDPWSGTTGIIAQDPDGYIGWANNSSLDLTTWGGVSLSPGDFLIGAAASADNPNLAGFVLTPAAVPEPGSIALLLAGAVAFGIWRLCRRA